MKTEPNIHALSTQNLRQLIDETERSLGELNAELDRREQVAQAREIENLETHMKSAELSLQTIRDFVAELVADLRGRDKT